MNETYRKETLATRMNRKDFQAKTAQPARPVDKSDRLQGEPFEAVFLTNWPRVYRLLLGLVGDPAEAEDLALETFMRLHDRASDLDPKIDPGGWLRRVALNLGLDAIRRWHRREHYELESGKAALDEDPPANPSDLLSQKEERTLVRKILAEMNPRAAQILILRYSGLSYKEIAVVLGTAATSVGPLLVRAEKEFKRRCLSAGLED